MTLGVVSIIIAMIIAIVSSFFAFRDDKKRPTVAGYFFIILSVSACGLAIYEHSNSEMEKKGVTNKLADSKNRELEALNELAKSQKKQEVLLKQLQELQEKVEKSRIIMSDINRPASTLNIEIEYKFDTTHPKISALIDELFIYADKRNKNNDRSQLSDNKESLVIYDPDWLIDFIIGEPSCDKNPDICMEHNGYTLNLISALGMDDHINTVQFYKTPSLHRKGIDSLTDTDKFASYNILARTPELNYQITIHKKPQKHFTYKIKQSYRRVFNNNDNMGGKDDIEDGYSRLALQNAVPGFEAFYSEIIVSVFDGRISTRSFSLDTDGVEEIEAGDYQNGGTSYFFIPHR